MTRGERPIGLGIIGLGAMGSEMLAVAAGHPDFSVRLAADVSASSVTRARSAHPGIALTGSPAEVLESGEIEAVYIATPPRFHAEYAILALERGKAVFCEKPLSAQASDGEAMVEAARRTGGVNAVNFALADRHAALEVERALRAGEVGEVRGVEVRLLFPQWPREFQADAKWLDGREQGGFVREVFSHFAYLTDRLLGPLTPAFVEASFPSGEAGASEVSAQAIFHAGRVPVTLAGASRASVPETCEWLLFGTRRSYLLRDWGELHASFDGKAWTPVALNGERGSERTRLSAFARAVRGGRRDELPDFAAGLRVLRVVEAFHDGEAPRA